jgi:hypothetical protein
MNKIKYTPEERTINQFKAIDLKQCGYQVIKLVEKNIFGETSVVAFGYIKTSTRVIKTVIEQDFKNVKESDFNFIYWN